MRTLLLGSLFLMACLPAAARDDNDSEEMKVLRKDVLKYLLAVEDESREVAEAYKRLFTHVGPTGLKTLTDDDDTSIALQAAWELYRKPVKRDPQILGRTEWVFDKGPMEQFLKLAAKRLKSEPPTWWGATLLKGDVFPGRHHAFVDLQGPLPSTATFTVEKDDVVITSGKQSVKIAKADFDNAADPLDFGKPPVILGDADLSFIARPWVRGYPFKVIGVDSKTGEQLWATSVWAARRGGSNGAEGVDPVEIRRQGNTIIVYGCDSHGMYAEGFDVKTGECRFRFCTCYWFNPSEFWGSK